jgi:hypothetical protein
MRSGFRENIVQSFNFYQTGKGIAMLPAVFAIEGKNMAGEPDVGSPPSVASYGSSGVVIAGPAGLVMGAELTEG